MSVVCFGELLLRLKSPGFERILQSPVLEATFCGSEANVAVDLANWGENVSFVTILPNNDIGNAALREISSWGINTSQIVRQEGRMGTFYLEAGANHRPSRVLYDREYSAFSRANETLIDWDKIFKGKKWFHISGITPALSKDTALLTIQAVTAAKKRGLVISCDLNYRKTLWKYCISPAEIMKEIVAHTDILIANEEDIQYCLELGTKPSIEEKELNELKYQSLCETVTSLFPNISSISITLRESFGANYNNWSACAYSNKKFIRSKTFKIYDIVDRVGAGDCFAAGIIYGHINKMTLSQSLEFATAASCLKHSIPGDFARIQIDEINRLIQGNASGRVER